MQYFCYFHVSPLSQINFKKIEFSEKEANYKYQIFLLNFEGNLELT